MYSIALSGAAHSGKSEVAAFFEELFEERGLDKHHILKFADPIYQSLECHGQFNKNRLAMQKLSDVMKECYGENIYVNHFRDIYYKTKKQSACYGGPDLIICDDLRYIQEFDLVKSLGFVTIAITADEETRRRRAKELGVEFSDSHSSETEVESLVTRCDFIIENGRDTKMEDLRAAVEFVFNSITDK